jgi:predicted ATPase/DNA-binding SARP family transcriptional activator
MMIDTTTLLEVSTLGRFEVRCQNDLLNWNRRKVCDLFKLLLSAEQHRLHREQIQDILWPTSSSEQATNSFGKTLYLLRRTLEPDLAAGKGTSSIYVLLEHETLTLSPDHLRIDADIFESSTKQLRVKLHSHIGKAQDAHEHLTLLDEFDAVLSLYRGDYLPEDLYEDWAQRRRDRLRRVHTWLLESAAELAIAGGKGQRACEYLQALLERNSADEQTHRQLMLVYARMGRRSEALNQYQLLREALREELHTRPLPETEALFRSIHAGKIAADLGELRPLTGLKVRSGEQLHAGTPLTGAQSQDIQPMITQPLPDASVNDYNVRQNPTEQDIQRVTEPGETPSQIDPDRILKAELVGREEQLVRLQRAFGQTRNGQRRVVFISGEPGIGKTRLSRDFTRWGEGTQQAIVLWGYCYEMGGLLPYQPIADAIGAHIRTHSAEELRSILGNSAADLAKIVPEIRFKLPELPQLEPLGPEAERRNLYNAVARYLAALAAEHPLIVILDDLQWADAATLQLLKFLTSQGASPFDSVNLSNNGVVPLYLMTYRADEVHETHPLRGLIATLSRGGIGEELRLQRLNENEVHQLLENMARHPVNPVFAGEIYRQTEGNPFFIGEAIRSLIFEGKLKWTGERWQATVKVDELEIPQSVRLLIERRLVQLSPDCRTTLALAAVLGRQFSSALLCQARNLGEDIVAEHIDNAIQRQLLCPISDLPSRGDAASSLNRQDLDLAFTHDKIREVLYQWLNPLRKRVLHRQVAQAMEARYVSRMQLYYCSLAYHYQMAEDSGQAVDYHLKAAQHDISVYAYVDAVCSMNDALELLLGEEERPRRAEILRQLSNTYLYTGRMDEAIKAGLASCALWRDLGEMVKLAEIYLHVAFCYHWQGRHSEAVEHIKHALQCLKDKPEEVGLLARAYAQWGLAATMMGDVPQAGDKLQRADELHAKIGGNDPFIAVVSLSARTWYAFLADSPEEMLRYALRASEVCRSSRQFSWEPMMTYGAAWAQMLLGRLTEGRQMAHDTLEKAQRHNAVGAQAWANLVYAFLAIQAGQWEEAQQAADRAHVIASMLHNVDLQGRILWARSVCAGWQGNWEQAIADITQALQMAQRDGETSMIFPYLLMQSTRAHLYAGKVEDAQRYLDQAMQLAQSRHYRQLPAIGWRLQGRIWYTQGKFDEAEPCFERSLAELSALDNVVEYTRTEEAYGLFYLARNREGDAERGQALIDSAKATFQRLGVNG